MKTYSFPYMSELVKAYLAHGHEVDVFSYGLGERSPAVIGKGPLRVYLAHRRMQPKLRALDRFRYERRSLAKLIGARSPDVVHAHWTYEFAAAALDTGIPALVTAHDSPLALKKNFDGFYWRQRAALGRKVLRKVSRLSAVSPELLEELLEDAPNLRGASTVIPNGTVVPSMGSTREAFAGSFVSIANGFDDRKNTKVLIEAFSMFRRSNPDSRLTLYGSQHGPGEAAWEYARDRDSAESVIFAGSVAPDDLRRDLLSGTQCLVHTSRWEACSMAILEAQAMGIPVIGGSNSGGVAYTLGYGSSGILTDVTSPSAVAEAMQRIASDPGLAERLSSNGLLLANRQFGLSNVVEAYLAQLAEISVGKS
ncbi:glycosyltransferase family 4 protein [Arthrobacter sp. NPDC056691]|uniref:glycosyltransferase family 4 protein n=1 Tax=Arthrobacter sp. NPDC056691 TaxID=3345913 RepID=UPI00367164B9